MTRDECLANLADFLLDKADEAEDAAQLEAA